MSILEFLEAFPTEEIGKEHFKNQREHEGVKCKSCSCTRHYWLQAKWQWQCASCGFRNTLQSGTIMQGSHLPIRMWYTAMAFMTFTKKGISAKKLQKQLDHKRYDTVWSLMHRTRNAMGNQDALYTLEGIVEFDEAHFSKATPDGIKLKRGKGSNRKQNVAVMAESTPLEDIQTGKQSSQCRYFKMKVLDSHRGNEVVNTVCENIDDKAIVFSDKSRTYIDIAEHVEAHIMFQSSKQTNNTMLKWVHIAISNAKRTLLGIYHKVKGKYLQLYLDEYCYKLNRRHFGDKLFERLELAAAKLYW